ncbi:MAG: DUF998 domain-containing protein [Acidobacteriota bacterium]
MGASIALAAALYLGAAIVFLGRRKPGYRHVAHSISELGEVGARDQGKVAFAVFLPVGLALAAAAALSPPWPPALRSLAACIAVGYVGGALFPCDPGSPAAGSWRQGIHNLAGAVEYLGGALSLFVLSETLGPVFQILGFVVGAVTVTLAFPNPFRGLIQRTAEAALFAGLVYGALRVGGA